VWCNIIIHGRIVILVRRGPTRFPRLKGGAPLVATLSPTIMVRDDKARHAARHESSSRSATALVMQSDMISRLNSVGKEEVVARHFTKRLSEIYGYIGVFAVVE
jgi:hypothetical protein